MRNFNPQKLAQYETDNWVAYYQKDWFRLLRISIAMVQEGFDLSLPQAIYGAYWVARAEIAAAPFPNNDIPKAVAYMTRFFTFIKRIHKTGFDPAEAARNDVNWWVVHRQLFNQPANQALVDALALSYATTYQPPIERVRQAAYYRAEAMQYSDRWVHDGHISGSPLIPQIKAELDKSYAALLTAVKG